VVVEENGKLDLRNTQMDQPGGYHADRVLVDPGLVIAGDVHTHPPGKPNLGFSGPDVATMVNEKDSVKFLFLREKQFMLLRTGSTPVNQLDSNTMRAWQLNRLIELKKNGASEESALRVTTIELSRKFGLAYYERQGGGAFERVDP
jgi:hypothetical protein